MQTPKRYVAALIVAFTVYLAYWSSIVLNRLYSMSFTINDIGTFVQYDWLSVHSSNFLYWLAYSAMTFITYPLSLNFPLLLVFQSAFTGLAVFPLFGIARRFLKSDVLGLAIAISYLFYFPLAGINWSGAHYSAFFPTLFIFGYYFYVINKKVASAICAVLSGLAGWPYFLFVIGFGIMEIVEALKLNDKPVVVDRGKAVAGASVALAGILLGILYLYFYLSGLLSYSAAQQAHYNYQVLTILLLFTTVLFIPLFSKRWAPFLLPYIVLIFVSASFAYPEVFIGQWTALFVPFIYLGLIEGIAFLGRLRVIPVLALAMITFSALSLMPLSPLNYDSNVKFVSQGSSYPAYAQSFKVASYIPFNAQYVVVQNNIPEALPRGVMPVVAGLGSYPEKADYVLADIYSPWFSNGSNWNMKTLIGRLWETGNYGVVAEASGLILIEYGYFGKVKYFVPVKMSFNGSEIFYGNVSGSQVSGFSLKSSDIELPPGQYAAEFSMMSNKGNATVSVYEGYQLIGQGSFNLTGSWSTYNVSFTTYEIYNQVHFVINSKNAVQIAKVTVLQTGPVIQVSSVAYPPQDLYSPYFNGTAIVISNVSNTLAWHGPYTSLGAGTYNVTFFLSTYNSSPDNIGVLYVTSDYGNNIIAVKMFNGTMLSSGKITMTFSLSQMTLGMQYEGYIIRWKGTLVLSNIYVNKTGV